MAWVGGGANWPTLRQDYRGAQWAELGWAINELEVIVGKTKTSWPAPVSGVDPVGSDFDGETLAALSLPSHAYVSAVKTALGQLVPFYQAVANFTVTFWGKMSGGSTLYSDLADLLNSGSYGAAYVTPVNRADPTLLLQIKEAIEKLVYPMVCFGIDASSDFLQDNERYNKGTSGSWEDFWDDTVSESEDTPEFASRPMWAMADAGVYNPPLNPAGNGGGLIRTDVDCDTLGFYTDSLVGTLVSGRMGFGITYYIKHMYVNSDTYAMIGTRPCEAGWATNINIVASSDLDSNTVTVTLPSGADVHAAAFKSEIDKGALWPTVGSKTLCPTLQIDTAEPANAPFDDSPIHPPPWSGENPRTDWHEVHATVQYAIHDFLAGDPFYTFDDRLSADETDCCRAYMNTTGEMTWAV